MTQISEEIYQKIMDAFIQADYTEKSYVKVVAEMKQQVFCNINKFKPVKAMLLGMRLAWVQDMCWKHYKIII